MGIMFSHLLAIFGVCRYLAERCLQVELYVWHISDAFKNSQ